MRSVELFAGAGGLTLGVSQAGFLHEAVVERDEDACNTILRNKANGVAFVKDWPLWPRTDVREFDYAALPERIDLLAAGPPCQPFSLGGKHRAYADERDMFPEVARAVKILRRRAILIENVRGLVRESFSKYFSYILLRLSYPEITRTKAENWTDHLDRLEKLHIRDKYEGLSYRLVFRVLNAADYGVPQRRDRVFIVGFRSDLGIEWSFPRPTHSSDALLWSQWIVGDYWEEHEVGTRQRPKPAVALRGRLERLESEGEPLFEERWLTVRDAIRGLPAPSVSTDLSSDHSLNPGARTYPGHTGSPLDEPAKTLKAGVHGVPRVRP